MKFSDFKSIKDVLNKYPLAVKECDFVPDVSLPLAKWVWEDIQFALQMRSPIENEFFYREYFINPFMRESWKKHPSLKMWINQKLAYRDELTGEPDYFIAKRVQGITQDLIGNPLLAVAEAKQENFTEGWGQCLPAMIACQKINDKPDITIYGVVATSEFWQFANLHGETFTRNIRAYTIHMPDQLFGALDYLFGECEKQAA